MTDVVDEATCAHHGTVIFPALSVMACAFVFLMRFFTMLYATLLVGVRAGAGVNSAEEQALSWGERAGRANSRFGQFLVADEFRSLRRFLLRCLADHDWIGGPRPPTTVYCGAG